MVFLSKDFGVRCVYFGFVGEVFGVCFWFRCVDFKF